MILVICALIGIILCLLGFLLYKVEEDNKTKEKNKILLQQYQFYNEEIEKLQNTKEAFQVQLDDLSKDIDVAYKALDKVDEVYKQHRDMAATAFSNYCDSLDNSYKDKENEYNRLSQLLNESYSNKQNDILNDINNEIEELNKIKASRTAAIQAQIREKEIKENTDFYCLKISKQDKYDIEKLEEVKKDLFNPRILSMLIWQTYYQKLLKNRTAEILGTTKIITGIYKITNLQTKECYIGQSRDIATRWTEHAKCGLGIDTPVSNKLYKSMQEYGLYNFSWELLEECPQDQLNEKEKYYIDLYDSYNFGFNNNKGVSK